MNPKQASANKYHNSNSNGVVAIPGKYVLLHVAIGVLGGSGNTIAIYDSTEALGANPDYRIATVDTTQSQNTIVLQVPLHRGLYAVVGGGTAPSLTFVYADMV